MSLEQESDISSKGSFLAGESSRITVIAPLGAMTVIHPLLEYYRQHHSVTVINYETILEKKAILQYCEETQANALLYIAPRCYAPRTLVDGPLLKLINDSIVVVGILPYTNDIELTAFTNAACKAHQRNTSDTEHLAPKSVAILSQWSRRYLRLADSFEASLQARQHNRENILAYRWSSDHLVREDMIDGLGAGFSMAVYLGHGRPTGWVGYRGIRAQHFQEAHDQWREPVGAIFSLCCENASRRKTGLSFSESLPLLGKCAASIGAVGKTQHIDNMRWALNIGQAVARGASTVDQVIRTFPYEATSTLNLYRIIGDPLAPLSAHPMLDERAKLLMSDETKYG